MTIRVEFINNLHISLRGSTVAHNCVVWSLAARCALVMRVTSCWRMKLPVRMLMSVKMVTVDVITPVSIGDYWLNYLYKFIDYLDNY